MRCQWFYLHRSTVIAPVQWCIMVLWYILNHKHVLFTCTPLYFKEYCGARLWHSDMFVSVVSFSPYVRVAFKAQIQRADHCNLLRQRLQVCLFHAQESSQQFGELHREKQVDTWIGNTVQACQQHEDGEGCSWNIIYVLVRQNTFHLIILNKYPKQFILIEQHVGECWNIFH